MQLKKYCVTVMDCWTPTQTFWTRRGATKHFNKHDVDSSHAAHLFRWSNGMGKWIEISCQLRGCLMKSCGGANCGCVFDDGDGGIVPGQCSVPIHQCIICHDYDYGDNEIANEQRRECRRDHDENYGYRPRPEEPGNEGELNGQI